MKPEFATYGGGCFWGVEKFLQDIPGVIDAVSGYAGGHSDDPTYRKVCKGDTGHAEVVNVEFNPDQISYRDLTALFIKSYRDITTQNALSTSQYRSIILYRNVEQKRIIEDIFQDFQEDIGKTITTQVQEFERFYEAEALHQDYYGSCRIEG